VVAPASLAAVPAYRYDTAAGEILGAIRYAGDADLDVRRITRILDAEHGRWVSAAYDRLRQFGYQFDRF
jgi:hypothetical protein